MQKPTLIATRVSRDGRRRLNRFKLWLITPVAVLLLLATPSLIAHLSCAYTESHLTQAQMVLAAKQAT